MRTEVKASFSPLRRVAAPLIGRGDERTYVTNLDTSWRFGADLEAREAESGPPAPSRSRPVELDYERGRRLWSTFIEPL